jgi:nitroreductase
VEFEHVLRGRRSIRAFRDDPVHPDVVRGILDAARWSPSWANTQPWNVVVVHGEKLRELTATLSEEVNAGLPSVTDIPFPTAWPPELKQRMRVRRAPTEGEAGPGAALPSVWHAWGAPTLLLFAIDERLAPEYACFDTGLLVQSVCLAAYDRGIGTCIEAMMVRYPDVLHAMLPNTADLRFVVGVALGYVDESSPVNDFPRERIEVDEFVRWVD